MIHWGTMSTDRREYLRNYQREWVKRRRAEWINTHGPCAVCGSTKDLEIDHINPEDKEFNASNLWSWKKERRELELKKCQILCGACHARKHEAKHGSYRKYTQGCGCDLCREANRLKVSSYRSRRRIRDPWFRRVKRAVS